MEISLTGGLLVEKNDKEIKAIHAKAAIEKKFRIHSEYLDKSQLRKFAPYLSEDTIGAMYFPEEGKANPLLVTPAFALKSEILGVQIIRQAEVKGISENIKDSECIQQKGLTLVTAL